MRTVDRSKNKLVTITDKNGHQRKIWKKVVETINDYKAGKLDKEAARNSIKSLLGAKDDNEVEELKQRLEKLLKNKAYDDREHRTDSSNYRLREDEIKQVKARLEASKKPEPKIEKKEPVQESKKREGKPVTMKATKKPREQKTEPKKKKTTTPTEQPKTSPYKQLNEMNPDERKVIQGKIDVLVNKTVRTFNSMKKEEKHAQYKKLVATYDAKKNSKKPEDQVYVEAAKKFMSLVNEKK